MKCIVAGCVLSAHAGRCVYKTADAGVNQYHTALKDSRVSKEEKIFRKENPRAIINGKKSLCKN